MRKSLYAYFSKTWGLFSNHAQEMPYFYQTDTTSFSDRARQYNVQLCQDKLGDSLPLAHEDMLEGRNYSSELALLQNFESYFPCEMPSGCDEKISPFMLAVATLSPNLFLNDETLATLKETFAPDDGLSLDENRLDLDAFLQGLFERYGDNGERSLEAIRERWRGFQSLEQSLEDMLEDYVKKIDAHEPAEQGYLLKHIQSELGYYHHYSAYTIARCERMRQPLFRRAVAEYFAHAIRYPLIDFMARTLRDQIATCDEKDAEGKRRKRILQVYQVEFLKNLFKAYVRCDALPSLTPSSIDTYIKPLVQQASFYEAMKPGEGLVRTLLSWALPTSVALKSRTLVLSDTEMRQTHYQLRLSHPVNLSDGYLDLAIHLRNHLMCHQVFRDASPELRAAWIKAHILQDTDYPIPQNIRDVFAICNRDIYHLLCSDTETAFSLQIPRSAFYLSKAFWMMVYLQEDPSAEERRAMNAAINDLFPFSGVRAAKATLFHGLTLMLWTVLHMVETVYQSVFGWWIKHIWDNSNPDRRGFSFRVLESIQTIHHASEHLFRAILAIPMSLYLVICAYFDWKPENLSGRLDTIPRVLSTGMFGLLALGLILSVPNAGAGLVWLLTGAARIIAVPHSIALVLSMSLRLVRRSWRALLQRMIQYAAHGETEVLPHQSADDAGGQRAQAIASEHEERQPLLFAGQEDPSQQEALVVREETPSQAALAAQA